jgi:nucleotide-binding universal stress UspA family protein
VAEDNTVTRRIAITLDAFELSPQALEQAVRLAQRMGAQLEGIFIEDIDLIQIAELPFLREVRTISRSEDAINLVRMEQELRALARRAERLLGEHAARHNVTWTFRIWRGSIDSDLLAADIEADVFALTRLGAALTRSKVLPARATAVSVLFTGTEASLRALDTAVNLATDPQRELNILLSAEDEARMVPLQLLAEKHLGEEVVMVHFIRLHDGSIADLLDILSDTHSAVLIVERDNKLLQTPTLRQNLNSLDCPLLIVR